MNDRGIYFITPARTGAPAAIRLFDFASAQVRRLMTLTKPPRPGLDVSPDGKWLLYSQLDHAGSDLMLVENFH